MEKCLQTPKMGVWIRSKLTYDQRVFQKTHLFKIWQNFKMRFLGKRSAPSKEGLFLKNIQKPQNGDSDQVKPAHLFNLTKILNYALSTERVLSWKIIGNINCFAYLEVQIRLYCLKRVPKKFCSKILEVRFLRLVLLLNIAPICNV